METFLQNALNGLTTGAIYACIAIGFTLVFGIVRLIYFAQVEMAMLGAFGFAYSFVFLERLLPTAVALFLALVTAVILAASVSCLGQRLLIQPLRDSPKVKALISSLGLSILLQNIVALWVSPDFMRFPWSIEQQWRLGEVVVTLVQGVVFLGAFGVWLLVWLVLYRTSTGRCIRAVAQSREGAALMGIRSDVIIGVTFGLAAAVAAVGGILMGLHHGAMRFDMGFIPGIKGFTIAILGGIGNIHGALVAGLLLGLFEALFAGYISSDYRDVLAFGLLVAILVFRPRGILGEGR